MIPLAVAKRIYVTRSPTGNVKIEKETDRSVNKEPTLKLLYEGTGDTIPISLLRDMSYSKIILKFSKI